MNLVMSEKRNFFVLLLILNRRLIQLGEITYGIIFLNNGISGKCLTFIRNMYNGVKSMVSINSQSSYFSNCNVGVRRGENLSPLLFSF